MEPEDPQIGRRSLQDFEGQRRVQRSKLLTRLTRIFVAWFLLTGLFVGIAFNGAFTTTDTRASNDRIAFGVFMVAVAIALSAVLHSYLLYSRRVRRLVDEPFTTPHHRDARTSDDETYQRFMADTVTQSNPWVPKADERPLDADVATPNAVGPIGDVDVLGQRSEAGHDDLHRSTDSSKGLIE